ncbi:MAG: HyaD/HybD family hydrogenase maturation endopeptidase [Actinomycetota bacterium]
MRGTLEERVLTVIGVGNPVMGDDGLGVRAAQTIRESAPPRVRVLDGGLIGLELIADVEDASHVLVIDAVDAGEPPGTVIELTGEQVPAFFDRKLSPHELAISDVLALASLQGREPEEVVVLGIQPRCVEVSAELSPEVEAALPGLVRRALAILDGWTKDAGSCRG